MSISRSFKITILMVLVMGISMLAACQDQNKESAKEDSVYTVKKEHFENALFYSGTLMPLNIINVPSPVDGVVVDMNFEYGQPVTKNKVIIKLNSDQLQKDYNSSLTEYLGAKDKLDSAKTKFKSSKELFDLGIISEENYKADKSEFDNANMNYLRSLYAIQAALKTAHGSFDQIKDLKISNIDEVNKALKVKYNNLDITALGNGVALAPTKSNSEDSGKIMLGSEVKRGQVLVAIGDMQGVSVDISINEIDIEKVKVGDKVVITGVAFPNMPLHGYVAQVDSQASNGSGYNGGLPAFKAKVVVPKLTDKQKELIRVGMTAKIKLSSDSRDSLLVPYDAVEEKDGRFWVRKLEGEQIKLVEVKTGDTNLNKVEILKGLNAGDKISLATGAS